MYGLMSDLVNCNFRKSMVIHGTECPYWDQVSLNNPNPNPFTALSTYLSSPSNNHVTRIVTLQQSRREDKRTASVAPFTTSQSTTQQLFAPWTSLSIYTCLHLLITTTIWSKAKNQRHWQEPGTISTSHCAPVLFQLTCLSFVWLSTSLTLMPILLLYVLLLWPQMQSYLDTCLPQYNLELPHYCL